MIISPQTKQPCNVLPNRPSHPKPSPSLNPERPPQTQEGLRNSHAWNLFCGAVGRLADEPLTRVASLHPNANVAG